MLNKIAFAFSVIIGSFLCVVAAAFDNGQYITRQPGVAVMLLTGIACAFGGSVLLRTIDPRDWPAKGFAGMIVAVIAASATLMGNGWVWAMAIAIFAATTIVVFRRQMPKLEVVGS